jgi:hypothetical protein
MVVNLSRYRAMVHYLDCPYYRQGDGHHDLPLPRTVKVRLCSQCRPSEGDVRSAPPKVRWYQWSPDPARFTVVHAPTDLVDNITARRSLGYGKTPARRRS